jgi:hypothetical protein
MIPVGIPVDTINPSRTLNVPGATFTGTQPSKSRPLNNDRYPGSASAAANRRRRITIIGIASARAPFVVANKNRRLEALFMITDPARFVGKGPVRECP